MSTLVYIILKHLSINLQPKTPLYSIKFLSREQAEAIQFKDTASQAGISRMDAIIRAHEDAQNAAKSVVESTSQK